MMKWMQGRGNIYSLLVRLQTGAATLETRGKNSQIVENKSTSGPVVPDSLPQQLDIILHRYLLRHAHCSFIYNSQGTQPKCSSFDEWINKVDLYTMEYYSSLKSNETMKFTGKWIKLENTLLSDANSHPERKNEACSFSFVFFSSSKFTNMNTIWSNQINLDSQK